MAMNINPWWRLALAIVLMGFAISGCGQPQVAGDHRDLVLRLATGASTRDPEIINRAAEEIDRLALAGDLKDDEEKAFRAILVMAKAGRWDQAQSLAYALRDGQEPTTEDQQRVAKRTLPGMKKPAPARAGRPTR